MIANGQLSWKLKTTFFMREVYSFYFDAFWIAVKSILEHKLRAFLTLIGIIIGVAAVVVVGASISGLKTYVVDKVGKVLGTNHFMITRMASTGRMSDEEFERKNRNNKDVIWSEYLYLRANCKNCLYVGAEIGANADVNRTASKCLRCRSLARPTICMR